MAELVAFRMPLVRSGDALLDRRAVRPSHPCHNDAERDELQLIWHDRFTAAGTDEVSAVAELDDLALNEPLRRGRHAAPTVVLRGDRHFVAAVSHFSTPIAATSRRDAISPRPGAGQTARGKCHVRLRWVSRLRTRRVI